jgi:hypothetical protein
MIALTGPSATFQIRNVRQVSATLPSYMDTPNAFIDRVDLPTAEEVSAALGKSNDL